MHFFGKWKEKKVEPPLPPVAVEDVTPEPPKPEPRRFKFADEDILELMKLQDAERSPEHSREAYYHLWRFIAERFPEVKTSTWRLSTNAFLAEVVEQL